MITIVNVISGQQRQVSPSDILPDGWIPVYSVAVTSKASTGNYMPILVILLIIFLLSKDIL